MKYATVAITVALSFSVFGEDSALAEALAAAGAAHVSKNHTGDAKGMLYRALVYDDRCGRALLELAQLYEKEKLKFLAEGLYRRAALSLDDIQAKSEAVRKADILNPFAPKKVNLITQYAEDIGAVARANPSVSGEAAMRLSKLGLAIPPEMRFFRGERMAEIVFSESMGYGIGDFKVGAPSHAGHAMRYSLVPEEMIGLKYTLIVPGAMSPLLVRFKTDGVLLVLLNKSFSIEACQRLEKLGAKVKIAEVIGSNERYETYAIRRKSGEVIELIFYVLVAADLTKGPVEIPKIKGGKP